MTHILVAIMPAVVSLTLVVIYLLLKDSFPISSFFNHCWHESVVFSFTYIFPVPMTSTISLEITQVTTDHTETTTINKQVTTTIQSSTSPSSSPSSPSSFSHISLPHSSTVSGSVYHPTMEASPSLLFSNSNETVAPS